MERLKAAGMPYVGRNPEGKPLVALCDWRQCWGLPEAEDFQAELGQGPAINWVLYQLMFILRPLPSALCYEKN